jgi:predicted  nucleic acid-binding Zn-ribbon protein
VYSDLKTLIDLQRVDQEIAQLSSQIETFPSQIQAIEKQLNDFIHAHEERQHRLSANQKERRDMEGEIQLIRQKISKHKDQLYQVKTNEQYRAMLKEIEGEEGNIRRIEDRILEKMIDSEELQEQVDEAAGRLDAEKARVAGEKATLEAAAKASSEQRDLSVRERQELAGKLNQDVLVHYERVRKGRGGRALAEVREGKCMGCNVLLRPQLYYDVRAGDGLYECENCARILYSLEHLKTAAEADGPQATVPN